MLDPIHIQSGSAQKRARWFLHAGLLLDYISIWQNLTQSAKTKLEPVWFCTIWSRPSVEEHNQVWKWETGSGLFVFCQKPCSVILHTGLFLDEMRLTKTWLGHPDWIWVNFAQYGPGLLWKNRTKSDVGSWIWQIWSGLILTAQWPQLALTKTLPDWIWHVYWVCLVLWAPPLQGLAESALGWLLPSASYPCPDSLLNS